MRTLGEKLAMRWTRPAVLAAIFAATSAAGATWGAGAVTTTTSASAGDKVSNAQLQKEIQYLKAQVAGLQARSDRKWMSQQEARQVRQIAREVLANAKAHSHYLSSQLQAGYDNSFFIRTPNKAFELLINGYLQVRYTFAHSSNPIGNPGVTTGDVNGIDFRRARLIFSGNVFHNIVYTISGDFAGASSNQGDFQILDLFAGYRFNNMLTVVAGSHLIPFTYDEYYSSGQEFPELPLTNAPYDANRGLGIDASGQFIKNTLSYEVNINDGSNSNTGGRVAQIGGALDNRMGYYARFQFAPAHDLSDFFDEADLQNHQHFRWMLGIAAGYEEQKALAGTFPSPQTSLNIFGLSSNQSPGFIAGEPLTGSDYRLTADWHAKYRGLSLNDAVFFQQVNDTGGPTDALQSVLHKSSIGELGYYLQAGYMFVPHRWEVVGRFEQLLTTGLPNHMEAYSVGLDYYLFGDNAKIQTALTFVPNQAAYTSPTGDTVMNTQDLIYQLQFQLKF